LLAACSTDEAPAAAIGDVTELLDVDVQHRTGMIVFVAADRLAGANINVRQTIQPTTH
jgi:hypothetical protein